MSEERGAPESLSVDNGPEFISRVPGQRAERNGFVFDFIESGKPTQNDHIESFNGLFRDDCLNQHGLLNREEAMSKISK